MCVKSTRTAARRKEHYEKKMFVFALAAAVAIKTMKNPFYLLAAVTLLSGCGSACRVRGNEKK